MVGRKFWNSLNSRTDLNWDFWWCKNVVFNISHKLFKSIKNFRLRMQDINPYVTAIIIYKKMIKYFLWECKSAGAIRRTFAWIKSKQLVIISLWVGKRRSSFLPILQLSQSNETLLRRTRDLFSSSPSLGWLDSTQLGSCCPLCLSLQTLI